MQIINPSHFGKEYREIIKAHNAGGIIEMELEGNWQVIDEPDFDQPASRYRVGMPPRLRAKPVPFNPVPLKWANEIKAWADGHPIECKTNGGLGWFETAAPVWTDTDKDTQFRVKPTKQKKWLGITREEFLADEVSSVRLHNTQAEAREFYCDIEDQRGLTYISIEMEIPYEPDTCEC